MKKTLTIALLSSIAVTSVYATTAGDIKDAAASYSQASLDNENSLINQTGNFYNDVSTNRDHLAKSYVGYKTVGLKTKAVDYKKYADEKLVAKKNKLSEREKIAKEAKGLKKAKAWKNVLSSKIEVEKQRGRVRAAAKAVEVFNNFNNDGYYKAKQAEGKTLKNTYVLGYKDFNSGYITPAQKDITSAFNAAKALNYTDYKTNINAFWNLNLSIWNNDSNLDENGQKFNEFLNTVTIEAISQVTNKTAKDSVEEYAKANRLAFLVTTLGNSEAELTSFINKNQGTNLYMACTNSAQNVANNQNVADVMYTIKALQNEQEISGVIHSVLESLKIDNNYPLINLKDQVGKTTAEILKTIIGDQGVITVDSSYNLRVDIAGIAAPQISKAVADNKIYTEVLKSQDLLIGNNTCSFDAVNTDASNGNKVAQALQAAVNHYANEYAKETGLPVDNATKEKVLLALEAILYNKIDTSIN
ncbi:hypothetical protein LO80_02930 [Candidatus Francisella endociliophora]|uniref:Uncharacterized protein n=1 Tax=Candidatus Francisella endociliophora TaxID=653937 RepID=A0A097EN88_9GAMM|nr:hypothetical protein [Francisella sp. FSC1006]AIT09031.1 hypothetical protein LO80_02930 [Francisella sp. FSC1006]